MILVFVLFAQLFNIFHIPQVEFVDFFLVWISNFAHRNRRSHCQDKIKQIRKKKQYPISEALWRSYQKTGYFSKKDAIFRTDIQGYQVGKLEIILIFEELGHQYPISVDSRAWSQNSTESVILLQSCMKTLIVLAFTLIHRLIGKWTNFLGRTFIQKGGVLVGKSP